MGCGASKTPTVSQIAPLAEQQQLSTDEGKLQAVARALLPVVARTREDGAVHAEMEAALFQTSLAVVVPTVPTLPPTDPPASPASSVPLLFTSCDAAAPASGESSPVSSSRLALQEQASPPTLDDLRELANAVWAAGADSSALARALHALLLPLRSGLNSKTPPAVRVEALRLCEKVFRDDGVQLLVAQEGALVREFASLSESSSIPAGLVSIEHDMQFWAVAALLAAARLPGVGLMTVINGIHRTHQDLGLSSTLCSGVCSFLITAIEQMFLVDAVMLQAALCETIPIIQKGLSGDLGCVAQEAATNLAVAVYLRLGVDESSQLLEGLEIAIVSSVFERFVDAEEELCFRNESEADASPAKMGRGEDSNVEVAMISPVKLGSRNDRFLAGREIDLSYDNDDNAAPKKIYGDSGSVEVGVPDEFLQWACDILTEEY